MLLWSALNANHFNFHFCVHFHFHIHFYEQQTLRFPKNLESSYVAVKCALLSANNSNCHFSLCFSFTLTFYEHRKLRFPKNLESSYVAVKCAQCKSEAKKRLMQALLDGRSGGGGAVFFFFPFALYFLEFVLEFLWISICISLSFYLYFLKFVFVFLWICNCISLKVAVFTSSVGLASCFLWKLLSIVGKKCKNSFGRKFKKKIPSEMGVAPLHNPFEP